MSGGPPHHPHGRQAPPSNSWNHLQVPSFFAARQPQHAHMSNEHPLLQQPTWHTPTPTEPSIKPIQSHIFSLEQMLSSAQYTRPSLPASPGVDLTLQRPNGGQNGDSPISLSVRDTNKINSLAASALNTIQPLEIGHPPLRSSAVSPALKAPSPAGYDPKKRNKRVDSILERLNPNLEPKTDETAKSVIVSTLNDENSNSSGNNQPTLRDDEVISPYSNEDSLDSNKSRRKRKPCKTIRLTNSKDDEKLVVEEASPIVEKQAEKAETIAEIAALVNEPLVATSTAEPVQPATVSVIKSNELSDSNGSNNVTTSKVVQLEVEDKLEEMFAGLEAEKVPEIVTSTSNELAIVTKSPKKKTKRKRSQLEATPKSGKKQARKFAMKSPKKKLVEVIAYDSGSNASSSKSRGPFIQIRGPRDSPLSVSVVNTPTNDDEHHLKSVKSAKSSKKFHDDSEYRHKVRSKGLHCSTLSHQYDAQTKDASWICAFCKRGPHSVELDVASIGGVLPPAAGDLFGPYFITTNSVEFERRMDDPYDKQFKSKKIARMLEAVASTSGASPNRMKKTKRKLSIEAMDEERTDKMSGITVTENGTFEIWAHEECIVWSAGIYLIGPKIVGLEEAVWSSSNVQCVRCLVKGANICCLRRGCVQVAHACCARLTNWLFDEDSYKTFCPDHRVL